MNKGYELHIYFVDGATVFLDEIVPNLTQAEAKTLWEKQYKHRRWGSVYSVEDKRSGHIMVPIL